MTDNNYEINLNTICIHFRFGTETVFSAYERTTEGKTEFWGWLYMTVHSFVQSCIVSQEPTLLHSQPSPSTCPSAVLLLSGFVYLTISTNAQLRLVKKK